MSCTLWPEFGGLSVKQGDAVLVEGKYTQRQVGEKTYHNLSVAKILVMGSGAAGEKPEVDNPVDDDEPLPF